MNKKVYSGYPGFKISLVSLFSAVLTIFFFPWDVLQVWIPFSPFRHHLQANNGRDNIKEKSDFN